MSRSGTELYTVSQIKFYLNQFLHVLWLAVDYIISCYNKPVLHVGDNNTEALIFKIATAQFLDVSEDDTNCNISVISHNARHSDKHVHKSKGA